MGDLGIDTVGAPARGERLVGEAARLVVLAGRERQRCPLEHRVHLEQDEVELVGALLELVEHRDVLVHAVLFEQVAHREEHRRELEVDVARIVGVAHRVDRGHGPLVEAIELPPRQAAGQQRRGDELALAPDLGDRHRLVGELPLARDVLLGHEDGRQHAAHPHLEAPHVRRQLDDRLLEQADEIGIGGLADVEADGRQRHHPHPGGAGEEHRVPDAPGPRRAVPGVGDGGFAIADAVGDLGAQQGQLGAVAMADLVRRQRVDACHPLGRVLVRAELDGSPSGPQAGGDPGLAVDQRPGLEEVVGEHGGRRRGVARLLDGGGDPPVQIEAAGAPETGADRLADQRVRHVQPAGTVLGQQPGGHGGVGGVEQVVAAEPAGVDQDRQRGGRARRPRPG